MTSRSAWLDWNKGSDWNKLALSRSKRSALVINAPEQGNSRVVRDSPTHEFLEIGHARIEFGGGFWRPPQLQVQLSRIKVLHVEWVQDTSADILFRTVVERLVELDVTGTIMDSWPQVVWPHLRRLRFNDFCIFPDQLIAILPGMAQLKVLSIFNSSILTDEVVVGMIDGIKSISKRLAARTLIPLVERHSSSNV
jgi:hypothetical protein